jgi:NAD(P)-dependent dehydrogenase (short-subunit alcohol dehydrogenase family)
MLATLVTLMPGRIDRMVGRVALVTGGSRGLGKAMVEAFAGAGADVIVASRKLDACEAVCAEVRDRFGVRALPLAFNVSDWAQCDALVDAAYAEFGRVDVLVNNAGLSPLYPSLDAVTEELFDKVVAINLRGPFRLTALIGSRMAAGEGGSVINISSVASVKPSPFYLPYAAAKAGLNALTEGFAQAWAPKVRVNGIIAGPFETDIAQHWDDAARELIAESNVLGRAGQPDEIVGAALYLASDVSSFTTGALLKVDGGTR